MRAHEYRGFSPKKFSGKWAAVLIGLLILMWVLPAAAADTQKKSATAGLVMFMRALGAQDPDPKTRNPDYLAEKLVNLDSMRDRLGWTLDFERMLRGIKRKGSHMFFYFTARTKHIDTVLRNELGAGAKQVVILGAGYDTRAYRFYKKFPKVRFFEVDLPSVSAAKQKRVKDRLSHLPVNVTYAPINFNTQDLGQVLAKLGYRKDHKTLFIWEGVIMYLNPGAVEGTLRFIATNSPPGSSVVFDYLPPSVVTGTHKDPFAKRAADLVRSVGEPFTFGIESDKVGAFLKKLGLEQVSNIGHDYMVKEYMTSSNGKPFGTVPSFFWIVQARVPDPKQ